MDESKNDPTDDGATREYIESLDYKLLEYVFEQVVARNADSVESGPQGLQDRINSAFGNVIASRGKELRELLEAEQSLAAEKLDDKIFELKSAIASIPQVDAKALAAAPPAGPDQARAGQSQPSLLQDPVTKGEVDQPQSNPETDELKNKARSSKDDKPDQRSKKPGFAGPRGKKKAGFLDRLGAGTWMALTILFFLATCGLGYFAWTQFTQVSDLNDKVIALQADPYAEVCGLIERQDTPVTAIRDDIQSVTEAEGFADMRSELADGNELNSRALDTLVQAEAGLTTALTTEDQEIREKCTPGSAAASEAEG